MSEIESMRLDKWLWCARFYKTRSIAVQEIGKGRVTVNGSNAKASREVRAGDTIHLKQGDTPKVVVIRGLSGMRGSAPIAQALYEETADSKATREQLAEQKRLAPEPASALASLRMGRPTKRNRRDIDKVSQGGDDPWGNRWSASIDD